MEEVDLSKYIDEYSLLAPGPVNTHPDVRKALAAPMIHHRTPEFDQILHRVLKKMKSAFETKQDVFLLTTTGSGGMECLLVNTLSPGDKIIVIVSGKFGERWAEMGEAFGYKVVRLTIPWGNACTALNLHDALEENPDCKAVLCQACETSTAVAHPIRELGELVDTYSDCLFLVDGITALGAYRLPFDEWKIDGLVAGSQKAFMLPTGMSFVCFSEKAWRKINQATTPRFYLDIRKEKAANDKGETYFSSSVSMIKALDVVLNIILKSGLPKHLKSIRRRAEFTRTFFPVIGMFLFSNSPSDSLTALKIPGKLDGQKMRLELENIYHITVMGGQDQLKGKILRVGHMGYIQDWEMLKLLQSVGELLVAADSGLSYSLLQKTLIKATEWLKANPE